MRDRRVRAAACLAVLLSASLLTGCGSTKIVLTTGIAGDELFRIGKVFCSLSEAEIYLVNQKNQYENVYGIEMWNHDFGEMTIEEYLKNQVVSQLAQVKSMVLLAHEREITLDEEEISQAAQAAEEYFSSLSQEETDLLKTSQEEIQQMYEDYCLAYKAYDQVTADAEVEISDDAARIIQLQQIFVSDRNLADELKRKLDNGEDFDHLASTYSTASPVTVKVGRGEKSEVYEQAAFELDNGGISDVFEADDGYYILKCLNTYVEDASEENKIKIAQTQKSERFRSIYAELMEDTLSEFQDHLWKNVSFADFEDVKTDSFFTVYQKYLGD